MGGLLGVAGATMMFGIALAVGGGEVFEAACLWQIDPTFWGSETVPPQAEAQTDFAFRALGSVIAGMGAGVYMIAKGPIQEGDPRGVTWVAQMLALWFVLDLVAAIPGQVWSSVALNVVFLGAYALPLTLLRHEFRQAAQRAEKGAAVVRG